MNMKNSRSRVGLLLFGIALSTVLVVMTGCGSKETTQTTSTSQSQFTAVAAKAGSVSVVVEAPAVVEPYLTQTVRSTIEGVVTFAVPEGASIKKGEVLVRFDQGDQQKAVRSAELARAQSRVNRDKAADALAMAVKDLGDKETLLKTGAVPQDLVRAASDAVTSAKRSLELADIVVAQAALALETAQNDLNATSVRAPIDGVVLSGNLNPGDLVARGGALLTVADISRLRLNAEVDEYDIGKVTSGLPVTVRKFCSPP
jgi:HlyD family secretion protein